jgi:hypothetical protein
MNLASALTDRSAKNIYINQNTVNLENQLKLLGIYCSTQDTLEIESDIIFASASNTDGYA